MGDNRLALELSENDGDAGRGAQSASFYRTQGRKYDTAGATALSIDMYIDSAFDNAVGRIGGLWGSSTDGDGMPSNYAFPIIEFFDSQFQVWDGSFGWREAGTPTGFAYDEFVSLSIVLNAISDQVDFFADGQLLKTIDAFGKTSFANAIIQGINSELGINRTLYFDNFEASVSAVPLPAALPLYGTGLAVMALLGWRKRRRAAV